MKFKLTTQFFWGLESKTVKVPSQTPLTSGGILCFSHEHEYSFFVNLVCHMLFVNNKIPNLRTKIFVFDRRFVVQHENFKIFVRK